MSRKCVFDLIVILFLVGALVGSPPANAAAIQWDGNGAAPGTVAADTAWNGAGGTFSNWSDNATPTGDALTFNNNATSTVAGTTTNALDTSYSVASIIYTNTDDGGGNTYYHTTALGGNTLTVTGNLTVGTNTTNMVNAGVAGSGTLTIGTALAVGYDDKGTLAVTGSPTVNVGDGGASDYFHVGARNNGLLQDGTYTQSGGNLNTNVAEFYVGIRGGNNGGNAYGKVDLTNVTTDIDTLYLAIGYHDDQSPTDRTVYGEVTQTGGTVSITVTNHLVVGADATTPGNVTGKLLLAGANSASLTVNGSTYIGSGPPTETLPNIANETAAAAIGEVTLPANGIITIGNNSTVDVLQIGVRDTNAGSLPDGKLTLAAGAGGTATINVKELFVALKGGPSCGLAQGVLDLKDAQKDGINITVGASTRAEFQVGTVLSTGGANAKPQGSVYLGSGIASAPRVVIGAKTTDTTGANGFGRLELWDDAFSVSTSLLIDTMGRVTTHVNGGRSTGLNLASAATLTINSNVTTTTYLPEGGGHMIFFDTDPDPANYGSGIAVYDALGPYIYYGLKWAGDHEAALKALAVQYTGTQIDWDDTTLLSPQFQNQVTIFYDIPTDATYVGFRFDLEVPAVPEPAGLSLVGLALLALRRRRS